MRFRHTYLTESGKISSKSLVAELPFRQRTESGRFGLAIDYSEYLNFQKLWRRYFAMNFTRSDHLLHVYIVPPNHMELSSCKETDKVSRSGDSLPNDPFNLFFRLYLTRILPFPLLLNFTITSTRYV
jgi:hypothetical protein